MEDEAGEDSQGKSHCPEENVVREHQDFCVSAAAKNALGHDAVRRLEDDDQTDRVKELIRDRYGLGSRLFAIGKNDRSLRKEDEERR